MSDDNSSLRAAAENVLAARLVLEPDSDEVLRGKRYAPVAEAAWHDFRESGQASAGQGAARRIRLCVGLSQTAQQRRRNEWSWRYEWVGFDWATVRARVQDSVGLARKVAVVAAPSVIELAGLVSVVSVPSWPALQLIGAVLAEDAELRRAAGTARRRAARTFVCTCHRRSVEPDIGQRSW